MQYRIYGETLQYNVFRNRQVGNSPTGFNGYKISCFLSVCVWPLIHGGSLFESVVDVSRSMYSHDLFECHGSLAHISSTEI
jgi:hypothetical protein